MQGIDSTTGPIQSQALQQGTDGVQIKVGNTDRAIKPGDAHTEDINEVPQPRRSTRDRKRPRKFDDYELLFSFCSDQTEPQTFKQACSDLNLVHWLDAMNDEMESLNANQTWDLVPLPPNRKALKNKWVYRIKEEDGGRKRYRARLVVKGFSQQKGVDFNEIFSLVIKM